MGRRQRLGLMAAAVIVAVVAFLVLGSEETDDRADEPATTREAGTEREPTATARSAPPPPPQELVLRGGRPEGGAVRIEVVKGEPARLLVSSDRPDEIHVHGYDLTRSAAPGSPARFTFKADIEGQFEIESHAAEDAGSDPLVARLVVEPS